MDRIYAVGCSNGGMFTYELAHDERSAKYLTGISTQVGLPHYGYNRGPHESYKIHHLGFWGSGDRTVPPIENPSSGGCAVPCRTSENNGWFYTSSECTMSKWKDDMGLANLDLDPSDYGIQSYRKLKQCSAYTSDEEDDAVVVGCIFQGGHVCNTDFMNAVTLDFFDAHRKVGTGNPPVTTTTFTSTTTTSGATATTTTTSTTDQSTTTTTAATTTTGGSVCDSINQRKECRRNDDCRWSGGNCVPKTSGANFIFGRRNA
mmetsp:Transcript_53512/g.113650  ORF Transcript_53512/g.113650 Transcript_53512/m.113650 type:complete len:260 (+) Transcript_53512:2-781(+)